MGQILFSNNAYTTLSAGCASGDATLTVASSSLFPAVTTASTNWFYACIQDTLANLEIVKVTNITGTTWTVTRAIGGTSARAFAAGSVVELRVTAETLSDIFTYTVTGALQNSTPQWVTGIAGGTAISGSLTPALTAYTAGQSFRFIAAAAASGATTLNINALGAKNITKNGTAAIAGGEWPINGVVTVTYDGTQFQLTNSPITADPTTTIQNSTSTLIGSMAGTTTLTGSLSPALASYVAGQTFRFVAPAACTGATTLNINSLGAKNLTRNGALGLLGGEYGNGATVEIIYDGTQFQMLNVSPSVMPQRSVSAAYTTVLADAGAHLYHPSGDTTARIWTIDSNANVAHPIGTAITFVNEVGAGVITIAITTDTLVLAGTGTTGSRTLAAAGLATALKVTSTRWIINGVGLT